MSQTGKMTNDKNAKLPDLNRREFVLVLALVVLIVLIGVFPNFVLNPMQASITELLNAHSVTTLLVR